ncbi:MAG: 1-deoxy-D-xylulose-5-phosphate reductoisomerase [Epsilonproteobacteria bacterium]|nr:1-deoxy-D-xylulose-5-phosphate reductoisomerase [Campylobacterota bacterium]
MVVLGSTGSIGVNTLNIAREFNLKVEALVANGNIELLNRQIKEFKPSLVAIGDESKKELVEHNRVFVKEEGILELLEQSSSKKVVNALVGFAGLKPTLKALELNRDLALANKESLVVAGKFLNTTKITPIDSEHFGLWYLLDGKKKPKRLIITASGGAFRDWDIKRVKEAKLEDALKHPNWSMGQKITIDSASMVNKLFELLEARWLFDTKDIDAVVERSSKVHALVEFIDGSTTAQLSSTDMRLPIAYALLNRVTKPILEPLNLLELEIRFEKIDEKKYPLWQIREHLLNSSDMGVVLNAANEAAIEGFIKGEYYFFDMMELILRAYKEFEGVEVLSLEDIFLLDKEVREFVYSLVKNKTF